MQFCFNFGRKQRWKLTCNTWKVSDARWPTELWLGYIHMLASKKQITKMDVEKKNVNDPQKTSSGIEVSKHSPTANFI